MRFCLTVHRATMADLFGLLQDLGERIASKGDSSGSTQAEEEDHVEARFRSVLPNLLEGYFHPSKVKEREITAILKLLCHTVKNYPGVFYHGKVHAVLPILSRIIPFFADPTISARHGVFFESLTSLASLLKNGDRVTYRALFVGAMLLLEDLVSVASFFKEPTNFFTQSTTVSIQCFNHAFTMLDTASPLFCEVPSCWKSEDGCGLLIDVTGEARWWPLAEYMLRFLGRCVAEGALHVEGLLTSPFICIVGKLLGFRNSSLQKACFDFFRVVIPVMDAETLPNEKIILSIASILSVDGESASFRSGMLERCSDCTRLCRSVSYDSALGSCLSVLFASSHKDTFVCTARALMEILPKAVLNTESRELKEALCSGYEHIVKHCPPCIWKLNSILELLFVPEVCNLMLPSLSQAFDLLGLMNPVRATYEQGSTDIGMEHPVDDPSLVGNKRRNSDDNANMRKRQRHDMSELYKSGVTIASTLDAHWNIMDVAMGEFLIEGTSIASTKQISEIARFGTTFAIEQDRRSQVECIHNKLLRIISQLDPKNIETGDTQIEGILSALKVLVKIFAKYPGTAYHELLTSQTHLWISWISCKGKRGELNVGHLCLFLEAIECLLYKTEISYDIAIEIMGALQIPWSEFSNVSKEHVQNAKLQAVSLIPILCMRTVGLMIDHAIVIALNDSDACIRAKMVSKLPIIAVLSNCSKKQDICTQLVDMGRDESCEVRKAVAQVIGKMACVVCDGAVLSATSKSLLLCSQCEASHELKKHLSHASLEAGDRSSKSLSSFLMSLQLLFTKLLFDELAEDVQLAFINSMPHLLQHSSESDVLSTKNSWLRCLEIYPVHDNRFLRQAFCLQIRYFFSHHVLKGLFGSDDEKDEATRELEVLGKLRHSLLTVDDPEVLETLVEMIAEVIQVAVGRRQLFFFAFVLLLEQVDSKYVSVQTTSVGLLQKCALLQCCKGDFGMPSLMVDNIKAELFEYLCSRILMRPIMIKEFAGVLNMGFVDLIRQMAPVVLPKLIIQQQHNKEALDILHELARQLKMELPLLLLECCHKVLSVLLLKADGKELMIALQFYESQTGSDTHEIFAAVLPALLDELVWFLGDMQSEDAVRRSARVAPMIQEVASIVTGSDNLPDFLRAHFVGLLNSIDRKMLHAKDLGSQKQTLLCLERLIEMIGYHLSPFLPKIMVLLTRALNETSLLYEVLQVWLLFVRKLSQVSSTNLKSIASQIVLALMPCLESHQEGDNSNISLVVEILELLIIENRNILDDQAGELPLLPTLPALANVNAALVEARGAANLHNQLKRAADGLIHESISVRLMASNELKKVINERRKDVMDMVLGEASLDATILSDLVSSLLRGCAEESRTSISQRFKLVCAECLGELGAIDPVKLQINLRARSKFERTDDDLIFELINEQLAKVLRAASNTDVQDAAALAIQELLKLSGCHAAILGDAQDATSGIYKAKSLSWFHDGGNVAEVTCSAVTVNDKGERLWSRFTDDVKEIITPCLTSKYLLKNASITLPSGPVFKAGMSFRRWIYLWVRRLILQSIGPRALIFNACRGVVRHDIGTSLYLLPYLVLHVICNGSSEARASVTDELLTVLAEAGSVTDGVTAVTTFGGSSDASSNNRVVSGADEVSIQAVFTLLDNLGQWLDECKQGVAASQSTQTSSNKAASKKKSSEIDVSQLALQCNHVIELFAAIPMTALARASFRCKAYARALQYFEAYVQSKSGALNPAAELTGTFADEDVTFLLEIYSGLDEPDGISGLSRLRKSLSLHDQILINEKAGNWAEALTCCEQALQMEPNSLPRHSGVLDCLLNMGHLQAMVTHVDGLISRFPEYKREWSMRGIQAAWRLGQWELLDEYLLGAEFDGSFSAPTDSNISFDISLAKILQAFQRKDWHMFSEHITQSRQALLVPLAAASMESYTRAYPFIVKLHMLCELENFQTLSLDEYRVHNACLGMAGGKFFKMIEDWYDRLKITQPSLWTREPILALRRLVFRASNMQLEVGACWLQYAKLCRAACHFETANRAILEAKSSGSPNAHMELAKLLWDTKKTHRAISELQQALTKVPLHVLGNAAKAALGSFVYIPSHTDMNQETMQTQSRRDEILDVARTLLLLVRWVHCTGQKQKEDVLSIYSRVRELQPKWEKGFFFLAKYWDDIVADSRKRQEECQDNVLEKSGSSGKRRQGGIIGTCNATEDKPWWFHLSDVILYYAKGLQRGHHHLFQALPRLLTIWFEFGSIYHGEILSSNTALKAAHGRVMNVMQDCSKNLPAYQWLTCFSQLISRICHQNEDVVCLVKTIVTSVLRSYPQQALWMMAAVTKSTVPARYEAAAEILHQTRNTLRQERQRNVFNQFATLTEQLIKICFYTGPAKTKILSLSAEFSFLKRMMPVEIIVPIQSALNVILPADGLTNLSYNPFSTCDHSTISGIGEAVEVLASLQRPKKVVLHGSDGLEHPFLCKPKDDLRKDARMMEFTTMINRLLSKDPQSRRRKLYIRTFAVIPLTEDCGMVEWVPHTRGLRHILQDIYIACEKFDRQKTNPMIKQIYEQSRGQVSEAEMFRTKILPMFPPVFHKWFFNKFTEPATWFQARISYAHTTAVWSMVGHIVGLGDRHGENILFDSTTGDCVHVDFSCLFDKGLQLEKPELVPFRLTQNMVDGLGITGYEGIFSRVCEITLSILRANRETLMSVLETFIHDPLVEWTKSHKSSGVEVKNPHAQRAMSNIEGRLQGIVVGVGAAPSLPLSVEGQSHRLISEAVSIENLAKMYIWWMPWF